MNKRNANIELLRIILFCFLVLTHLGGQILSNDYNAYNNRLMIYVPQHIAIVSVTIFSMITGYFDKPNTKTRFWKFLNYFVFASLFSLILFSSVWISKIDNFSFIKMVFFLFHSNWYLWAILVIYALQPLISKILKRFNLPILSLIVFLSFVINIFVPILGFGFLPSGGFGWGWLLSGFLLGYLIKRTNTNLWLIVSVVCSIILLSISGWYFSKTGNEIPYVSEIDHRYISTVVVSIAIFTIFLKIKINSEFLLWLSKRSVFFYPVHHTFLKILS